MLGTHIIIVTTFKDTIKFKTIIFVRFKSKFVQTIVVTAAVAISEGAYRWIHIR